MLKEDPDFSKLYDYDPEDGEYIVFGDFASFIIEAMEDNEVQVLVNCFDFINDRIKLSDHEVKNLFEVQLFEAFLEAERFRDYAKEYLKEEALESFKNMESQAI